jgi:hypothetical protein
MKIHCLKTTITMENTGKLERIKIESDLLEEALSQKLGDLKERSEQLEIIKPAEIKELLELSCLQREKNAEEALEQLKISYHSETAELLLDINHSNLLKNPEYTLKWLNAFEILEVSVQLERIDRVLLKQASKQISQNILASKQISKNIVASKQISKNIVAEHILLAYPHLPHINHLPHDHIF